MSYSPLAIQNHMFQYLPRFTNLFTDETSVSAEIVSGSPQTLRITLANHGYIVGNVVKITNSLLDNGINAVQEYADAFRFTTNVAHDLSLGYVDNLQGGQIELQGFTDSSFNGFFDLLNVPSSTTFEIDKGSLTLPVLNGSEVLRENREIGINELLTVTGVPDANTIDILLTGYPQFDTKAVVTPVIVNSYRIGIAADVERANEIYTKSGTDKLWAYIIMDDVSASKDRNNETDAVQTNTAQNELRVKNIGMFNILVIVPTSAQLSGQAAIELCYNEVYETMMSTLTGVQFDVFGNSKYVTTMTGHSIALYENAKYSHIYTFENVYETIFENTFLGKVIKSSAFRRINISFADIQDGSNIIL